MKLTTDEKVRALRELTKGAEDVFAARSDNMWRPVYSPLTDENLIMHMSGIMEIGSYPLIPTDDWPACFWVGADFDGKRADGDMWKIDVSKTLEFLNDIDGCPSLVNLSRSGHGAHIRMLFREAVPAWMARRWMTCWLEEAGVLRNEGDAWSAEVAQTFDRLIPPQDRLSTSLNWHGARRPGNLMGSPLHAGRARHKGGTLPLHPVRAEQGDYEPDGKHWEHVLDALDKRAWGQAELRDAMTEWDISLEPPHTGWSGQGGALPLLMASEGELDFTLKFCSFMTRMRDEEQPYELWVALASQLHRFGDAGREAFHALSATDARYTPTDTDLKWEQTSEMSPVRCDTLVSMGYRCPHLHMPRCNGAKAPAFFVDGTDAEILLMEDDKTAQAAMRLARVIQGHEREMDALYSYLKDSLPKSMAQEEQFIVWRNLLTRIEDAMADVQHAEAIAIINQPARPPAAKRARKKPAPNHPWRKQFVGKGRWET